MKPRIETTEIVLVGVQAVIRLDHSFVPDLERLYQRLFARLQDIPDIDPASRTFGYWHFVDAETRLYFAGVQVERVGRFRQDHAYGLVDWSLGKTTWAVWPEPDGQEGSIVHGGVCWRWLDGSRYHYDDRFIGDFEVTYWQQGQIGQQPRSNVHEIWIPIIRKGAIAREATL